MRILIVTPLYPPDLGTLSAYIKNCAKNSQKDHQITIATYGHIPEEVPNIKIICTEKRLPIFVRSLLFTYRLWKAASKQDMLYVSDGASVGVPAVLVSWLRQIPLTRFIMTDEAHERLEQTMRIQIDQELFMRHPAPMIKIRIIRNLQNWVLRQTTHCFFPDQKLQDLFVSYYNIPEAKTSNGVYPPQDLEQPPFPFEPVAHQLLCLSPIHSRTAIDQLFADFLRVCEAYPDTRLILAHEYSNQEALRQKINELGLSDRVQSLGFISRVERAYLLKTSAALVMCDNLSTPAEDLYHAYQAMIPVIQGHSFTDQINKLFDQPEHRTRLLQQQAEIVKTDFDWQTHLNKVFSL